MSATDPPDETNHAGSQVLAVRPGTALFPRSIEIDTSRRIALALGGGGARGIGHVAILEVFDELGIKPAFIAGTSIGALIGAAYAAGLSAAQIRAHLIEALDNRFFLVRQLFGARSQPIQRLLNVLPLRSALIDPEVLLDLVLPTNLPGRIEEFEIPFAAITTDMQSQTETAFTSGPVKQVIAASIAIPVLFSPVTINDRLYGDGGLVAPLPIDQLPTDVDLTVAIDVTGERDPDAMSGHPSVTKMLIHSIAIFQKTIIREQLRHTAPDLYLDLDVGTFGALHFHRIEQILKAVEPQKALFRDRLIRLLATDPAPPA
jgi:NTE family protein